MPRAAKPYIHQNWYVSEAGGKGIHKLCPVSEGFDKAQELLPAWLEECRQQRAAGTVRADAPYTVAQLAAEFLRLKEATKMGGTVEYYRKSLERLVDWYGNLDAEQVRIAHATEYICKLRKLDLSNTSVNHHIQAAKAVLNYAVDEDRLRKNPWHKVEYLPAGKRKRIVTDEEFAMLLKACDKCIAFRGKVKREDNAQTMRDILHILRFTALRPGELRKLRWDHIRWEDDVILIPAAEQKTGTTAKDPEDRMIPILEEAKAILQARKEKYGHQPLVFPNILGKQWTDQLFSNRFARLRKRAGLDEPDRNGEKIVPYSLRHTRLTEAGTREGWQFYTLMKLAGHTTAQMTKRYVHPGMEDLKRAAREGAKRRASG